MLEVIILSSLHPPCHIITSILFPISSLIKVLHTPIPKALLLIQMSTLFCDTTFKLPLHHFPFTQVHITPLFYQSALYCLSNLKVTIIKCLNCHVYLTYCFSFSKHLTIVLGVFDKSKVMVVVMINIFFIIFQMYIIIFLRALGSPDRMILSIPYLFCLVYIIRKMLDMVVALGLFTIECTS